MTQESQESQETFEAAEKQAGSRGSFPLTPLLALLAGLVSCLLSPAISPGLRAQSGADSSGPPAARTFEESRSVVLVQVPVYVTDRSGEPVRGLERGDFRLFDEGEEQPIERLEVIDHAKLAEEDFLGPPENEPPAAGRRGILLLFDLSFARSASVIKARSAALDFVLGELAPGDLAAVATLSVEEGPRLLVTFTPDRAQLARAIDTLGRPGLTGRATGDPLRFVLERLPVDFSSDSQSEARSRFDSLLQEQLDVFRRQQRRVEKNYERSRITDWTRSLSSLAASLAKLQGSRHVVLFSEGFESSLVFGQPDMQRADDPLARRNRRESSGYWLSDADETFGHTGVQTDVLEMARVFRRSGATLHAVDLGGLVTGARADGASPGEQAPRGGRDSLFFLADATGGELLRDANDFAAGLSRLLRSTSLTYLLSYYPRSLPEDGSFRELRVEVAKEKLPRGAEVKHREGYFSPEPFAELHPLERSLLASEALAAPTPREDFRVEMLAAPFRAGESLAYVPVILEIDGKELLAAEHEASGGKDVVVLDTETPVRELRLEIFVYASDAEGRIRDFATQQITVSHGMLGAMRGIKFYGHLRLPASAYQLRVLVRDQDDGRTAVLRERLEVPDWSRPTLLPPFAIEERAEERPERPGQADQASQWLMLRHEPGEGQETVVYPFLLGGEPYVPAALPRVAAGETLRVALVGYGLAEGDEPDAWQAEIYGDDGVAHPYGALLGLEVLPTRVHQQTQLAGRLDPQDLRPGRYTLEVTSPEGATSRMEFLVRQKP